MAPATDDQRKVIDEMLRAFRWTGAVHIRDSGGHASTGMGSKVGCMRYERGIAGIVVWVVATGLLLA